MYSWRTSLSGWGPAFSGVPSWGIVILGITIVVLIAIKGYSLWYAARKGQKWWFIVMLIINTMGILEILYLIFVVKIWSKHGHKNMTKISTDPTPTA